MNTSFNINTERNFQYTIESIIDSKGLSYLLNTITEICEQKSQHLSENWQDAHLSKQWDKTAVKLDKFRLSIENICPLF